MTLSAPETKLLFSGPVEDVLAPGTEGDFLVLRDHAPVMTALRPGIVDIGESQGKHTRIFVRGGFADVSAAGLIPSIRPTRTQIFTPVKVDFTLFANVLATAVFAALLALSTQRLLSTPRPRERPHEGRP